MTLLGAALFVGFDFYRMGMTASINDYYEQTNLPDLWISGENLTQEDLRAVLNVPGVKNAEGRLHVTGKARTANEEKIDLHFIETNEISQLYLTSGKPFDGNADEIWLDDTYAAMQNIRLGDSFSIQTDAGDISGTVAGLVKHPEYVYYLENDSDMAPNYGFYGFAFMSTENLPKVEEGLVFDEIIIDVKDGYDEDAVRRAVKQVFPKEMPILIYKRNLCVSYSAFNSAIVQAEILGTVFPVVFLIVAFLGIATTMVRLTAAQRMQIGTLKALGFTKGQIMLHYMSFGFWICLAGAVLGGVFGSYLIPEVQQYNIDELYVVPEMHPVMSARSIFMVLGITLVSTLVTFFACRNELADAPAVALRPKKPKISKKTFLEQTRLWNHLQFGTRWNLRDILRNRMRTFMGVIAIAGCCMLLICSFGLIDTCFGIDEWMYNELFTADGKVTFKDSLPLDDRLEYAREYDGQVTQSETVEIRSGSEADEGVINVIDTGNLIHFQNYDLKEIRLPEDGVLMTRKMAESLGVKAGELVEFRRSDEVKWHGVRVVDFYLDYNDKGIAMTSDQYQNMRLEFLPDHMYTNHRLPESFLQETGIEAYNTREAMKTALMAGFASVTTDAVFLITFALLLGGVMLFNLGSLSFSEKIREMATLKVLGFHTKTIQNILKVQNIWITVVGIVLGIPMGRKFLEAICASMSDTTDMPVILHFKSLLFAVGLTYLVSAFVNWAMAGRVKDINMVEALKGVE